MYTLRILKHIKLNIKQKALLSCSDARSTYALVDDFASLSAFFFSAEGEPSTRPFLSKLVELFIDSSFARTFTGSGTSSRSPGQESLLLERLRNNRPLGLGLAAGCGVRGVSRLGE